MVAFPHEATLGESRGAGDGVWFPKYQSGRSIWISRSLRFAGVVSGSFAQRFDVERAVKQQDEQAGFIHSRLMLHGLARREVDVCAGPDNAAIGIEAPLQHDDRMGGGVPVKAASHAGRITDEIVLFAGSWVLVEKP